ncbi:thiamine ABC transporter substrate-binding protein [Halospeciosus flavus]|uniref:Thiamine ABC transporter substrate binding subunit n=1 Tax=Halospeciosus flavus TaxID=3032283 RepID=A0ABD5Z7R9_9EURY|nr:thiamine ABC transporter substrate-binding protein [Halospeciosus flavus]
MRRRDVLKAGAGAGLGLVAGCAGNGGETTTTTPSTTTTATDPYAGELHVATYQPFVDAPSVSPGSWIKEQFEKQYPKATLKWLTPQSELNYFVQRKQAGVGVDADVYVGLNADDLVRVDQELGGDDLFEPIDAGALDNEGHVRDELRFDPKNRAIPFDTGYISLVYNEKKVSNPQTFETLAKPEYASKLLAQNAQTSDSGQAFLLWTIATLGEENYLDYWKRLVDNGARLLDSWSAAYSAYLKERPMVVSYSTDQVYAHRYDQPLAEHQVGFLNDQGYANPEGMARFADTDTPELATAFVDFMLSKEVQSKIPVLNVAFPATDWAEPPESFSKYAHRPPETVTHSYDELKGNLDQWVEQWARQVASN